MKECVFVPSDAVLANGYRLDDGRLIDLDKLNWRYDAMFDINTGEIDANSRNLVNLNMLIKGGRVKEEHCYQEEHCYIGEVHQGLNEEEYAELVERIQKDFRSKGYEVSTRALNYVLTGYRSGLKSAYRDEENGVHLFVACWENPLNVVLTTLHEKCKDWQTTYIC